MNQLFIIIPRKIKLHVVKGNSKRIIQMMKVEAIDKFSNMKGFIKSKDVINMIKYKQILKCLIDIFKATKTVVISKPTVYCEMDLYS